MKKYILTILFYLSLAMMMSGCYSIYDGDAQHRASYMFMFQWEAEIFARRMEKRGFETVVYKNNWFNNGGYPWGVGLKDKIEKK
jgi:hypothetical protein